MSYYSRNYRDDTSVNLIMIGICLLIIFLLASCSNLSTSEIWNNGICPDCETRYELRGVSRYFKYYACPDCGQEVERY